MRMIRTKGGLGSYERILVQKHRTLKTEVKDKVDWLINLLDSELPVVVTDQGKILFANDSACEIMGYPFSFLVGKSVIDIIRNTSGIRSATDQIAHQRENNYIHEYQHPIRGLVNICAHPRMVRVGKDGKILRVTALSIVAG